MNFDVFQDPKKKFSIVLFVQTNDFANKKLQIEGLGRQRNVRLVVQPCPYEGIEFLYRVADQLIGHHTSLDKEVFWQAIALAEDVPDDVFKRLSEHHHRYLVAILEQNAEQVATEGRVLESLSEYYD